MVLQSIHLLVDHFNSSMTCILLVQFHSFAHTNKIVESPPHFCLCIYSMLLGLCPLTTSLGFPEGQVMNVSGPIMLIFMFHNLKIAWWIFMDFFLTPVISIPTICTYSTRFLSRKLATSKAHQLSDLEHLLRMSFCLVCAFHIDVKLPIHLRIVDDPWSHSLHSCPCSCYCRSPSWSTLSCMNQLPYAG